MNKRWRVMVCLMMALVFSGIVAVSGWSADASAAPAATKSVKKAKKEGGERAVARTRSDMILEVELKALREALDSRQDQDDTNKFADKAQKEFEGAKLSADQSREMLKVANDGVTEVGKAKEAALAAIEKAKAAAEEARALADEAKKNAKLGGVDVATFAELKKTAAKEVLDAEAREASAQSMLAQAREKEQYYRDLVKRRIRNAEDFYYIAEAAMRKGGNAQALEFAVKAKAEMEQAKIAENEAAIRAEATNAVEKVVEARKSATESAKLKSVALAKILKLADEIAKALDEAAAAAKLTAAAAAQVLAKTQDFATAKDEILTFTSKKVESLGSIKDASERKESMAQQAAESALAVVAAKQKALAEAESRARTALADARGVVIGTPEAAPASAGGAK